MFTTTEAASSWRLIGSVFMKFKRLSRERILLHWARLIYVLVSARRADSEVYWFRMSWGPWSWARTSQQKRWRAWWGCRIAWTASKASALLANFNSPSHSINFTLLLLRHSHFELKRDRSWWSFKAQWTTKIKLAAIWWKFFFPLDMRVAQRLCRPMDISDETRFSSVLSLHLLVIALLKWKKFENRLITLQSLGLRVHSRRAPLLAPAKQTPCPRVRWLSRGMIDSVINAC